MIGWRIFYDDHEPVSSKEMDWDDAPYDGVQVVMIYKDSTYRKILQGYDWYFSLEDGALVAANNDNPEVTKTRYKNPILKRGRWSSKYAEIVDRALESLEL